MYCIVLFYYFVFDCFDNNVYLYFQDVVDGVETVGTWIEDGVEDVVDDIEDGWEDVEDVVDVLEGKNATWGNTSTYSWSYNYNEATGNASSTFYIGV